MTNPNTDLTEQIAEAMRDSLTASDGAGSDLESPGVDHDGMVWQAGGVIDVPHLAAAVMPIVEQAVKRGQAEALRDAATGIEKSDRSLPGITVSAAVRSLRFRADDLEGGDTR